MRSHDHNAFKHDSAKRTFKSQGHFTWSSSEARNDKYIWKTAPLSWRVFPEKGVPQAEMLGRGVVLRGVIQSRSCGGASDTRKAKSREAVALQMNGW